MQVESIAEHSVILSILIKLPFDLFNLPIFEWPFKVRKMAKIRKQYNQVPRLTQDTTWESNKNTINITNKSQEVSPFPAGNHKAAMNRCKSMRNTRHKNKNDPQKK